MKQLDIAKSCDEYCFDSERFLIECLELSLSVLSVVNIRLFNKKIN